MLEWNFCTFCYSPRLSMKPTLFRILKNINLKPTVKYVNHSMHT